jgi:hypothetical protein
MLTVAIAIAVIAIVGFWIVGGMLWAAPVSVDTG